MVSCREGDEDAGVRDEEGGEELVASGKEVENHVRNDKSRGNDVGDKQSRAVFRWQRDVYPA